MTHTTEYALKVTTDLPYADAVARTRTELAHEGFGVLTEIDMADTMRKKLSVEFRPYTILGACNPPLAAQALDADLDIGLLLPCNVIVYADGATRSTVAAIDPVAQLAVTGNPEVEPIAREVREKLQRVVANVAA